MTTTQRHETVSEHTAAVLRAGVEAVRRDAERFDMDWWVGPEDRMAAPVDNLGGFIKHAPSCGATLCFAGFLLTCAPPAFLESRGASQHISGAARDFAGLDRRGASLLFHALSWPTPIYAQFKSASNKQQEVEALAARVEHFIQTGE